MSLILIFSDFNFLEPKFEHVIIMYTCYFHYVYIMNVYTCIMNVFFSVGIYVYYECFFFIWFMPLLLTLILKFCLIFICQFTYQMTQSPLRQERNQVKKLINII